MPVLRPYYQDVFKPRLLESEALAVSDEQKMFIREVLEVTSADSKFAEKAYAALVYILTNGSIVTPTVTSLNPSSVVLGSPYFDVHVIGTGFTPESIIVFNGFEEPTTYVSATELTTGVNMPLWSAPAVVPIAVLSDGILSNSKNFTFSAVPSATATAKK